MKITKFQNIFACHVQVQLAKAPACASYSASVYLVGVINGVWGAYRSGNGGGSGRGVSFSYHKGGILCM